MKLTQYSITAAIVVAALAASAQMFSMTRLLPKDVSKVEHFALTISSTNTGGTVDFSVTVTPKTSEYFFDASLACFDGEGQIALDSLEYPEHPHAKGEPCEYRFGVATNLLAHSQFIIRYSTQEQFLKERAVDSIWFFLRDFAPSVQPSNDPAANRR
jgi:hypothetical protein